MNKLITVFLVFICLHVEGQNLVPNNGFDTYTFCPSSGAQDTLTPPWFGVNNHGGSPDYMNACFVGNQGVPSNLYGYQTPVSDSGYYGLITYYMNEEVREYLTVPISSPLINGITYTVGFYVCRAENLWFAADHIGAYLSVGPITGSGDTLALPYVPQIDNPSGNVISDTTNWTLVSGTYTASGGENYLTIGNFYNDLNTQAVLVDSSLYPHAYYYIDEVFLGASNTSGCNIVINEVALKPEGEGPAQNTREWIELYNPSCTDSVDLTGWHIRSNLIDSVFNPIYGDDMIVTWATRNPGTMPYDSTSGPLDTNTIMIPPKGFAVILDPTWNDTLILPVDTIGFWIDIPDNTIILTIATHLNMGSDGNNSSLDPPNGPGNGLLKNQGDFV
ncbi:MAG TPA: lamin tail domain-containing protein, partial [Flavobacteriales bacterium]|nr:lamin tail domain-containing protein [Flavobacteriales bacterium]